MDFERPVHFNKQETDVWTNYYQQRSKMGSGIPGYMSDVFHRGKGITGYRGDIFQRGEGFFDALLKFGLPVVKYLGPKVANTLISAGADALEGNNFGKSLINRGKQTAEGIVSEVVSKATGQNGSGKRKRRKTTKKSNRRKLSKRRKIVKSLF
jgi:hypothetical protein